MCGLCGAVRRDRPASEDERIVLAMMEALVHRGPDSAGTYLSPDRRVRFGFRRLSIVDLAGGDQPLSTGDGTIHTVVNGEIYNHPEIRRTLEGRGHEYRSGSDCESLLHAYAEWGVGAFSRLRGMYAAALFDENRGVLLLARDALGKKPLFFTEKEGALYFSSELGSLGDAGVLEPIIDPLGLDEYLTFGYVSGSRTVLDGVRRVRPGEILELDTRRWSWTRHRSWSPTFVPKFQGDEEEAASELRRLVTQAVQRRRMSDVPLGALLSGGLDSSVVVAVLASLESNPVSTFTIGFEDPRYDERSLARIVSERYGTDHHEHVITPSPEMVPAALSALDEPLADASVLPTFEVARLARRHVTVVLNGDGGDEIFGGYRSHKALLRYELARGVPRSLTGALRPALALAGRAGIREATAWVRLLDAPDRTPAEQFGRWSAFGWARAPEVRGAPDGAAERAWTDRHFGDRELGLLDTALRADLVDYLPGDLLVKMDRMTMAVSLEARSPFLDQEVVDFATRLPPSMKSKAFGPGKRLVRRAFGHLLPDQVLAGPKKGFSVPLGDWLAGDLSGALNEYVYDAPVFDSVLSDAHLKALRQRFSSSRHRSDSRILWALLVLGFWAHTRGWSRLELPS